MIASSRRALLAVLLLALPNVLRGADDPFKTFTKSIEKGTFVFRANEALCRRDRSVWNQRTIFICQLKTEADGSVSIEKVADWEGSYFFSGTRYAFKSAALSTSSPMGYVVKLWAEKRLPGRPQDEIQLVIPPQRQSQDFEKMFFSAFLRASENPETYQEKINDLLLERFINPEPELAALSTGERQKTLTAIRLMGFPPQPKLERVERALYIPASLGIDTNEYNDLKVTKNQRLATTIDKQLKEMRSLIEKATDIPEAVKGIKFQWSVAHRDFLKQGVGAGSVDRLELLVPLEALKGYSGGNVSAFELVQKSILRSDGIKETLATFDPIGAR